MTLAWRTLNDYETPDHRDGLKELYSVKYSNHTVIVYFDGQFYYKYTTYKYSPPKWEIG